MGVPKFFRWISERYPCLSEVIKEYQIPEFDNLYLDMNGIIHNCSHPNDFDPHFRITEEKIFSDIFHYIEILFRMIQPQRLFFMAVDGVAPRAKMNQQRGRRFRSAKEAEVLEQKARERGETLPQEERFDSNCITPGTVFMARLHEQLKYFVVHKISTDRLWRKCKVILSGHETPGEGEHKIMDYIRYMKSQPDYDPNTRHCLYGLDADLMMLGLCSHEPHFSLLREEVKFGKKQRRASTPEVTTFFLLHLSLMREYLELEFQDLKTKLPFPFDLEKIIDDWVLMGFLVGNDFIPPLPDMHIANGALPTLYKAYIDVLPTLGGYINEGGSLNLPRFQAYMERLSSFDFDQFRDTYADLKYFESKTGRKMGGTQRHSYKNNKMNSDRDLVDGEEPVQGTTNPDLAALIKSTDEVLGGSSSDDDGCSDTDDDDSEELFLLEFSQHKKDYYMNKLEYGTVDSEVLRSQAEGYVRAIQWNLNYYYNGVCSWSWFYPHHYAPYISDIRNFSDLKLEFDIGRPFLPFEQLLAVLPAASKRLLPEPFQELMVEPDSPIINYFPQDFRTDLNGKKQEWEALVLIPFIDEEALVRAMEPRYARLTEEERHRNRHGPMLVCSYTEEDLGPYSAPEYFPTVSNNHALVKQVDRSEIEVPRDRLVKGLCPGVLLEVYFPGFPTLKHIPHTASLQRGKVKVFEQNSRGDTMVLRISDQGRPDLQEVASELLGRVVYVSWPHLVEARVVAVSNKDLRYTLSGDNGQARIEEVRGCLGMQWAMTRRGIQEHYMTRLGVEIGDTTVVVHASTMVGRKYVYGTMGKITLDKQWCQTPVAYALQTIVKDIAVHSPNFVQYKTLQEIFPLNSQCFMLGHPHYGAMGEVVAGNTMVRSGRVKLSVSVCTEPNLEAVRRQQHDGWQPYLHGNAAAQKLGISSYLLSRLTSSIFIAHGSSDRNATFDSVSKTNVGLNLKFNKRNEEIPGYTRKEGTTWLYSHKTVELVRSYMQAFPELFDYLALHTGNDFFFEQDIFSSGNGSQRVAEISAWLREQPYSSIERQACGAEVLDPELVQQVEDAVDAHQLSSSRVKTVVMQVKPHLLHRAELVQGNLAPDPTAVHRLFDRVINIRSSYTVPLGLKGTIIGIHKADKDIDTIFDVVFDKPFPGGLRLNCSESRGYRMPQQAFLNISHGQRTEQIKSVTKPTAIVQPSGNSMVEDSAPGRPTSAFASWSPLQPPAGRVLGPSVFRAVAPLFHEGPTAHTPQRGFLPPAQSAPGTSPTEFQTLWNELQKSSSTTPTTPTQGQPAAEATDPGAELLKKMLRIDDAAGAVTQTATHPPVMKKLSVQEIFDHARTSETKLVPPAESVCVKLVTLYSNKGLPSPRYNYITNSEDGSVKAQCVLHDMGSFSGDVCMSKEQACESAARVALSHITEDSQAQPAVPNNQPSPPQQPGSVVNLPTPPQQWYQNRYHRQAAEPPPTWRQTHGNQRELNGSWRHPHSNQHDPNAAPRQLQGAHLGAVVPSRLPQGGQHDASAAWRQPQGNHHDAFRQPQGNYHDANVWRPPQGNQYDLSPTWRQAQVQGRNQRATNFHQQQPQAVFPPLRNNHHVWGHQGAMFPLHSLPPPLPFNQPPVNQQVWQTQQRQTSQFVPLQAVRQQRNKSNAPPPPQANKTATSQIPLQAVSTAVASQPKGNGQAPPVDTEQPSKPIAPKNPKKKSRIAANFKPNAIK